MAFNEDFERDILTTTYRRPDFFADYYEVIDPKIFKIPAYRKLWLIWQEFFNDHRELPTQSTLIELIGEKSDNGFFLDEDIDYLKSNFNAIMNGSVVNEDYIENKIKRWIKERRLERQISEAIKRVRAGEAGTDEVLRIIKDAEIDVEVKREKERWDFAENLLSHLERKKVVEDERTIPTGIVTLDEVLGGGPKRGYKCILMGPPGMGKTTLALNMTGHAVMHGYSAMYCFNDDTEYELYDRFIANLARVPIDDIISEEHYDEIKKVAEMMQRSRSRLQLRQVDEETTPDQIYRMVERRFEEDDPVDIVVVDHIRNLRPRFRSDDGWRDIGNIFKDLARIAIDFDVILWGVQHTKRTAENKMYMSNSDIGLSYEPVKDANLIMAVWRTVEDLPNGPDGDAIRVQITKHRSGPTEGALLRLSADFDRMQLSPLDEVSILELED